MEMDYSYSLEFEVSELREKIDSLELENDKLKSKVKLICEKLEIIDLYEED